MFSRDISSIISKQLKPKQLGLIFHWGLYSVPAFRSVSKNIDRLYNGSEWYMKRLYETNTFRPVADHKATKRYHQVHYGQRDYFDFAQDFAVNYDPDPWMKLAKQAGATYVILTARHHDGYCLWPSKVGPSHSQDLVGQFVRAARANNLKVGLYYSWMEFNKPVTIAYTQIIRSQMDELMHYSPDIWWFDGHWEIKTKFATKIIKEIIEKIKIQNPFVQINDRLDKADTLDYLSTYRNHEDRFFPPITMRGWEHIETISTSWGRNRQQKADDYKTGEELVGIYKKTIDLGGRLLLNFGPNPDGSLDPLEVESFLEFIEKLD